MRLDFSVNETVSKRYSVRTYDKRKVDPEEKDKLMQYAESLQNPLGPKVHFKLLEKSASAGGEKLGTYGIISGAELFLGATVANEETALEALGYDFEKVVLFATSMGLGTCWLGGTYNKSAFAKAMAVKENELFPIVSPVGYPAKKQRTIEKLMRRSTKAANRFEWDQLFFENDFSTPLTKEKAGVYEFPLEMLRLAPSAVNKQPWRVVYKNNAFHFFELQSMKGEGLGMVDIQRIDMGIAICHFHLAAIEGDLSGKFVKAKPDDLIVKNGMKYIISWLAE